MDEKRQRAEAKTQDVPEQWRRDLSESGDDYGDGQGHDNTRAHSNTDEFVLSWPLCSGQPRTIARNRRGAANDTNGRPRHTVGGLRVHRRRHVKCARRDSVLSSEPAARHGAPLHTMLLWSRLYPALLRHLAR